MKRICVFCGSATGASPAYADAARALAAELVRRRLGLVYGGGSIGLMGVLADAVLAGGGEVIGVLPRPLATKELMHTGLTELRLVGGMHERKATMGDLADAFVALPGGLGTFEETLEVLTWSQLGIHQKPVAVLDVAGYWRPLAALLDGAVAAGFVTPENRALLVVGESAPALLDRLAAWTPPAAPGIWLRREEA